MKTKTPLPLYRQRPAGSKTSTGNARADVLREAIALPGIGLSIPVRAAKAKLSALLEMVAGGQEVTITSDGKPKARLVAAARPRERYSRAPGSI